MKPTTTKWREIKPHARKQLSKVKMFKWKVLLPLTTKQGS